MKTMKKALSLLLSVLMVLALCVTAFADESNGYTITVSNETSGYTYTAYQIFDASVDSDGVLGDVKWGAAVDGATILAKLQADETLKADFESCTTAADVAKVLTGYQSDSAKLVAFADIVGHNLKADATGTAFTYTAASGETKAYYSAHVNDGGYYLVVNSAGPDGASLSRYLLKVIKDETLTPKTETPTIDKKITNAAPNAPLDNSNGEKNTAAIGDVINYEISGNLPDTTGYTYYYYIVNDKLSSGLTLNADSFTVKVVDKDGNVKKTLTTDEYKLYTDTDTSAKADEDYTFQLTVLDMKTLFETYGATAKIVVTYTATVNENAVIGTTGNPNEATLTYSNNPNTSNKSDKTGEPGKPDNTVPKGTTPKEETVTYVTQLELLKVDGNNNPLQGAEFTLYGKNLTQIKFTTGTSYVAADDGTYWKLKDGTYTTTDPAGEGVDTSKYASTTQKYKTQTIATATKVTPESGTETSQVVAYVNDEGKITFTGLNAGTYTLKETKTPAGYNTAADITFTIGAEVTDGTFSWTNSNTSTSEGVQMSQDGKFTVTVINLKGSTLPSTGGMGTTIFYVVGTVLVLGAAVVLIAKKRMSSEG